MSQQTHTTTLAKSIATILLRVLTVYDDIKNTEVLESHPQSDAPSTPALALAARRKRLLGLTIPMLLWHGYQRQYVPASWGIFTLYMIQILGGTDATCIQIEVRVLGPVLFSIISAACTLSIYTLYFIAVWQSTASWAQAVIQLPLLVLPDVMGIARSARRIYADITQGRGVLQVVVVHR